MSRKNKDEKPHLYKCPYCKKLFYTKEETVAHMKKSHKKAMNSGFGPTHQYDHAGSPSIGLSFSHLGAGW